MAKVVRNGKEPGYLIHCVARKVFFRLQSVQLADKPLHWAVILLFLLHEQRFFKQLGNFLGGWLDCVLFVVCGVKIELVAFLKKNRQL